MSLLGKTLTDLGPVELHYVNEGPIEQRFHTVGRMRDYRGAWMEPSSVPVLPEDAYWWYAQSYPDGRRPWPKDVVIDPKVKAAIDRRMNV